MQGELFSADLLSFPLHKTASLVREVAEVIHLMDQTDTAASDSYWKDICKSLADIKFNLGFSADQVDQELEAFADAVYLEMKRIGRQREKA